MYWFDAIFLAMRLIWYFEFSLYMVLENWTAWM